MSLQCHVVLLPAVVLSRAPQLLLYNLFVVGVEDVVPALEHGGIREERFLSIVVPNMHHLIVGGAASSCVQLCVKMLKSAAAGGTTPYEQAD